MGTYSLLISWLLFFMITYPQIDPVAFAVGPVKVHWYGIMYLFAFAAAWLIAWKRSQRADSPIKQSQVEDLIVYGALGVVLGGRFGYVMFYNFDAWLRDPLWLFRVWEGGMSFHGGLLGVILAIYFYCRRVNTSFLSTLDFVAPLVPLGLGFGRLGNFIGQELWGRATDVSWGMIFPRDPEQLVRHPSQLYQAFLEGLVLFAILFWFSRRPRPQLAVGAMFLIFYGIFRFVVEFVRQPDDHINYLIFGWMTRGQLLTIPMVAAGIMILIWAYTRHSTEEPVKPKPGPNKTAKKTTKKTVKKDVKEEAKKEAKKETKQKVRKEVEKKTTAEPKKESTKKPATSTKKPLSIADEMKKQLKAESAQKASVKKPRATKKPTEKKS